MIAASSDTLMKAITGVFGCILTHFWYNWYNGDFLPNSLFEFFQSARPIFENLLLQIAPHEEVINA